MEEESERGRRGEGGGGGGGGGEGEEEGKDKKGRGGRGRKEVPILNSPIHVCSIDRFAKLNYTVYITIIYSRPCLDAGVHSNLPLTKETSSLLSDDVWAHLKPGVGTPTLSSHDRVRDVPLTGMVTSDGEIEGMGGTEGGEGGGEGEGRRKGGGGGRERKEHVSVV